MPTPLRGERPGFHRATHMLLSFQAPRNGLYLRTQANSCGSHVPPRTSQGAEQPAPECCSLDGLFSAISAGVEAAASWVGLWLHWILNYDWPDRQNEQHSSVAGDTAYTFIASGMTRFVLVFVLFNGFPDPSCISPSCRCDFLHSSSEWLLCFND